MILTSGCNLTIPAPNNSFYNFVSSDIININYAVNLRIKPYKEEKEEWYYIDLNENRPGDCDDYVITKLIELEKIGIERQNLRLASALTEGNEHHLVLLIQSNGLWYILDNRIDTIVHVDNSKYQFLLIENPEKGEWFYAGKYLYPALSGYTNSYSPPNGFINWCKNNKDDVSCMNYFKNYGKEK